MRSFDRSGFLLVLPALKKVFSIVESLSRRYQEWEFVLFTLLTLLSILKGQTTIFYIIYFFWWAELIRLPIDAFWLRRNPQAVLASEKENTLAGSIIPMGIYLVFIVVFFGFIANFKNENIMFANMRVLVFQNWFFNLNLLLLLAHRIVLHRTHKAVRVHLGAFTPHMIVLHVSIVVGGVLLFFVVRNYPQTFTPDNLWGSVLIISPFFLLKILVEKWNKEET